jgi:hypothetical protein
MKPTVARPTSTTPTAGTVVSRRGSIAFITAPTARSTATKAHPTRTSTVDTWKGFLMAGPSHLGHSNSPSSSGIERFCGHREFRVHRVVARCRPCGIPKRRSRDGHDGRTGTPFRRIHAYNSPSRLHSWRIPYFSCQLASRLVRSVMGRGACHPTSQNSGPGSPPTCSPGSGLGSARQGFAHLPDDVYKPLWLRPSQEIARQCIGWQRLADLSSTRPPAHRHRCAGDDRESRQPIRRTVH